MNISESDFNSKIEKIKYKEVEIDKQDSFKMSDLEKLDINFEISKDEFSNDTSHYDEDLEDINNSTNIYKESLTRLNDSIIILTESNNAIEKKQFDVTFFLN